MLGHSRKFPLTPERRKQIKPLHLRTEHLLLARGPSLMDIGFVLEFLGQMFQPLEPHELGQEPLFEAFLAAQKAVPGPLDVSDHFAFGWHVSRPIGRENGC